MIAITTTTMLVLVLVLVLLTGGLLVHDRNNIQR
jgi:hypothetical protein